MSMTACLYALSFGAHSDEKELVSLETVELPSARPGLKQKLEAWQQRVCQKGSVKDNSRYFDELKSIHDELNLSTCG